MPTRLRKVRRLRGSRTMSWGQVGQHRKSGGRGGRGAAGYHKHKWSYVLKYEPDHFGKDKFVPPTHREVKKWINVGQLDELAEKLQLKGRAKRKTLDLKSLGFEKLLGGGIVKGAYRVLVAAFTEKAKAKVEAAGGEVVQV